MKTRTARKKERRSEVYMKEKTYRPREEERESRRKDELIVGNATKPDLGLMGSESLWSGGHRKSAGGRWSIVLSSRRRGEPEPFNPFASGDCALFLGRLLSVRDHLGCLATFIYAGHHVGSSDVLTNRMNYCLVCL